MMTVEEMEQEVPIKQWLIGKLSIELKVMNKKVLLRHKFMLYL